MDYDNWKLDCGDDGKNICSHCENLFYIDDLYEEKDELYCIDCWDDKFAYCTICKESYQIDELDNLGRCEDCQEDED